MEFLLCVRRDFLMIGDRIIKVIKRPLAVVVQIDVVLLIMLFSMAAGLIMLLLTVTWQWQPVRLATRLHLALSYADLIAAHKVVVEMWLMWCPHDATRMRFIHMSLIPSCSIPLKEIWNLRVVKIQPNQTIYIARYWQLSLWMNLHELNASGLEFILNLYNTFHFAFILPNWWKLNEIKNKLVDIKSQSHLSLRLSSLLVNNLFWLITRHGYLIALYGHSKACKI